MKTRRLLCVLAIVVGASAGSSAQDLRIYHIDVEQASATLFVAPNGKTLLVDGGENGMGDRLKDAMDVAGVSQIDFFVLTHYHDDHDGGIDELVEEFDVPVVQAYDRGWKNRVSQEEKQREHYKNYQRAVGEDAIAITPGTTIPLDPSMTVKCIASSGAVIGETNLSPGSGENDNSVSLLIEFQGFTYFIGGDTERRTETRIADRDLVMDIDVYVANHHGSHSSTSTAFIQDLMPRVVIISNGNHNGHEHPRQVTLVTLAGLSPAPDVFQTNKVYHSSDGGGNVVDAHIADPESSDADGTILITVRPSTGQYVVSYRSNISHTFPIKNTAAPIVPERRLVIASLLPNPDGDDAQLEEVTIANRGTESVSLTGWSLVDEAGLSWVMSGQVMIAPGQSRVVKRNGRPMSLNNAGDVVRLLDVENVERDQFEYTVSQPGVRITTGH